MKFKRLLRYLIYHTLTFKEDLCSNLESICFVPLGQFCQETFLLFPSKKDRINVQKGIFFFLNENFFFFFGCVGSSFLCEGLLQLRRAGATLHRGARASHRRGLSRCGAQAPDAQAQQLWLTGPIAPRHVGSSQTRARTRVSCIGRQTLNHCSTREAPGIFFLE